VKIDNRIQHPKYKKYLNKFLFFKVHDNYNQCKVGDIAIISECRKLSKTKTWELVSIV
jgi:small subunit ribosomal protein S17